MHGAAGRRYCLKGNGNGYDKAIEYAQVGVGRVVGVDWGCWVQVARGSAMHGVAGRKFLQELIKGKGGITHQLQVKVHEATARFVG